MEIDARATTTANIHAPTSNTAAVVTKAAVTGQKTYCAGVYWSYTAAPTNGNLKIEDVSGTTVFNLDITAAGPGFVQFEPPIFGTANSAFIVTLAAGGSGISGKVNINAWYQI